MLRDWIGPQATMRRWGFVDAADPASASALAALGQRMSNFYAQHAATANYWELADEGNAVWSPSSHPFHCHLATQIPAGATVVDFGCGTAHAIRNLHEGVKYIGIEGSPGQVELNRKNFPQHRFVQGNMLESHGLEGVADWAVSFFAIEHCVRPDLLLQRMLETLRPGGRLAILCPNFAQRMGSIRTGLSALSKREKLRERKLFDVLVSYVQDKWVVPKRVAAVHRSAMRFPIYMRPRCFDAPYFSDSDAVYMVAEQKLRASLEALGSKVEVSTSEVPEGHSLNGSVIYLVASKPSVSASLQAPQLAARAR
jgi:SAM-dependent methyltransferase